MGNIRALENHRFRRKLVQVRSVTLYTSVASERVRALLVGKKQNQVRLSLCGHEVRVRSKSAVPIDCNDSTVAVAVVATRMRTLGSARASGAGDRRLASRTCDSSGITKLCRAGSSMR